MFLLSQNDENQSENGSKNSKIRLRARPPAEPQKKMLQTKKLKSKSWKTRGFFTFRLPILDGRVHEQVSSVLFFTVFFEGERQDLSKTGGFGRKMPPPVRENNWVYVIIQFVDNLSEHQKYLKLF